MPGRYDASDAKFYYRLYFIYRFSAEFGWLGLHLEAPDEFFTAFLFSLRMHHVCHEAYDHLFSHRHVARAGIWIADIGACALRKTVLLLHFIFRKTLFLQAVSTAGCSPAHGSAGKVRCHALAV